MTQVIYMGSPDVALPTLEMLLSDSGLDLSAVFTQPDRPVGRKRKLQPCPVKAFAETKSLKVYTPNRMRDPEGLALIEELSPDLIIVCAYGQILPKEVLDAPPLGCYNLHFSLLPRWRGASPVQAALLAGDTHTGVSLQKMAVELDAGPLVAETPAMPLIPGEKADALSIRLAQAASHLLKQTLPVIMAGKAPLKEQDVSQATFCRTIKKTAGAVDFKNETAINIWRKSLAYHPWPGVYAFAGGMRLNLVELSLEKEATEVEPGGGHPQLGILQKNGLVETKAGTLRLVKVKPEGKKEMPIEAFLNGQPHLAGQPLFPAP